MNFRRPMTRSFSGNGRSSSINEEDIPTPSTRADSRNYLANVRPENRSTLCSVMAQLTEETQPSFETTLKSRAVCEDCNVKFTCVVSGYPPPELTWYKDDMEMDRYCGLPKYEIFRDGNTHTLHIYNCTVEDAAIYQASARNSKGIVSCSGVLEVGTMNEFKIHQQFFSKLKQKADNKRRDLEESRKKGKENVLVPPEQLRTISPERPQRKRRSPGEAGLPPLSTPLDGEGEAEARLREVGAEGVAESTTEIPNGFPADARAAPGPDTPQEAKQENGKEDLTYIYETVEIVTTRRPPKEPLAKKRQKISNGVDSGKGAGSVGQGSAGESEAKNDGDMSITQYLTETSRLQTSEDKQAPTGEAMEVDPVVEHVAAEIETETANRQTELSGQTAQSSVVPEVKAEVKPAANKEPDPPNGQTPLSSVFFSLRDIFFGSRNDKDGGEGAEDTPGIAHDHPAFTAQPRPDPQTGEAGGRKEASERPEEETVEMQVEERPASGDKPGTSASPPNLGAQELQEAATVQEPWASDKRVQGDTVTKTAVPGEGEAFHLLHEPGGGQVGRDKLWGFPEATCANPPRQPPVCLVAEDHMQTERNEGPVSQDLVTRPRELEVQGPEMFTSAGGQVTTDASETDTLCNHGQTVPSTLTHGAQPHSVGSGDTSTKTETSPQKWGLEITGGGDNAPECSVSPTFGYSPVERAQDLKKQKDQQVKESAEEHEDGSLQESQANSSALVQERVLMEGEGSAEVETILKTQGEGEEDVARSSAGQTMAVEVKPPEVRQQEESMTNVPATSILESRITDVSESLTPNVTPPGQTCIVPEFPQLEETLISVPKAKDIIQPPPSLAANIPISEQSGSGSGLAIITPLTVPVAVPIPENVRNEVTLSQQVQEAGTSNKKLAEGNDSDRHIETNTASIPVTNTSLKGDNKLSYDPEPNNFRLPNIIVSTEEAVPKVSALLGPPISVTCEDSPLENNQLSKDVQSLGTLAHGVQSERDTEASVKAPETKRVVDAEQSGMVDSALVTALRSLVNQTEAPDPDPTREPGKDKQPKESQTFVDQLQKDKPATENLGLMSPEAPMLSPTTLRRFAAKGLPVLEAPGLVAVPAIRVEGSLSGEKRSEDGTGKDTPPSVASCESSPRLKRRDSLTPIPSATPEELASGARRKIYIPKSKGEGGEGAEKEDVSKRKTLSPEQEAPYLSPSQSRRASLLQPSSGQQTPPTERRSPLLGRKKATLEVPKRQEEVINETETAKTDVKPVEEKTLNPFKAPQVIRKIRGEPFPDAVGHLKLWCQFFNVLSDSTIRWYRDEVEIAEVKRSAGDESQVALALVQTSSRDCGVYACSIKNEYGTDTTDFLLSADILSDFLLREDLEVGEEIEMTPMLFTKGLADPGYWGNKLFGRIMTEEAHIGEGCSRKACRMKVIYGLEPIFESGSTCITKVRNPIAYGNKDESSLAERNLEITKQECKIQNTVREYCKVFAAEARVIENFGPGLEVIPLYLMYRPANTIPYATVEADLQGVFLKYSLMDSTGRLIMRTGSEVEQKCCSFQHWIHQWTNGNLLVTQLEGVDMKITNIGIATKSKGYQGLSEVGTPKVFEQFVTQHQCNYYCGLLGLRTLKSMDSLQQPAKIKASRSPLLSRKAGPGSSSPQLQKKGVHSPQAVRKAGSSPKVPRKVSESTAKQKATDTPKAGETR